MESNETSEIQSHDCTPPSIRKKKDTLTGLQVANINEPRVVHDLEVPPVDWARLAFTVIGRNKKGEKINEIIDMQPFASFEKEVRESLGLPNDSNELSLSLPFLCEFLTAFETLVSRDNLTFRVDDMRVRLHGLEEFTSFAYFRGFQNPRQLDQRPEVWKSYREYCKDIKKPDGTEYSAGTLERKYFSFLGVFVDAGILHGRFGLTLSADPSSKLSKALTTKIDFSERDKKYRLLKSTVARMVLQEIEYWREIQKIVLNQTTEHDVFPFLNAQSATHFGNRLRKVLSQAPSREKIAKGCELAVDQKGKNLGLTVEEINTILDALSSATDAKRFAKHPLVHWLQIQFVTKGFGPAFGLKSGKNKATEPRDLKPMNLYENEGYWGRSTTADSIYTFSKFIESHGHSHFNFYSSLTQQRKSTLSTAREILYPSGVNLLPLHAYINLVTGWNLDTIQQIAMDPEESQRVVSETEHTQTIQLQSKKNRAEKNSQTTYIQVVKAKRHTSLNIPRILHEYRTYLLFLNRLAPITSLSNVEDAQTARALFFFPYNGERDRLLTYSGGAAHLPQINVHTSDCVKTIGGKLKAYEYGFTEGRRLFAEHLFEISGRNINAVKAELGHQTFLITYLQNEVFVRKGQLEVSEFQGTLLDLLSESKRVDPTTLTIAHRETNPERKIIFLNKLEDYRSSHGLSCSTGYVLPTREKETCRSGRCTLCSNARMDPDSWMGLSERLGELLWLQASSDLGVQALKKHRVYEEQDAILSCLMHPEYQQHVTKMPNIWNSKIQTLQKLDDSGALSIDFLLE